MSTIAPKAPVLGTLLTSVSRIPTNVHIFPGLPHGFRRWNELPASQILDLETLACVKWALQTGVHEDHHKKSWQEHGEAE